MKILSIVNIGFVEKLMCDAHIFRTIFILRQALVPDIPPSRYHT